MNKNIKTAVIGIITALILAGVAYIIYRDFTGLQNSNDANGPGYTIKELSTGEISNISVQTSNIPVPDLNRMVMNNKDLPPEAVEIVEKNIRSLSEELKRNPDQLDQWLDLGIQRKTAGDYEGARDAWDYATAIRPSGSVAFQNLGDLYGYYLRDNMKAEQNFLKAIQNSPSDIYLYFKLNDFYRDVLKDVAKARSLVEQGFKANPSSAELQSLLNSL